MAEEGSSGTRRPEATGAAVPLEELAMVVLRWSILDGEVRGRDRRSYQSHLDGLGRAREAETSCGLVMTGITAFRIRRNRRWTMLGKKQGEK